MINPLYSGSSLRSRIVPVLKAISALLIGRRDCHKLMLGRANHSDSGVLVWLVAPPFSNWLNSAPSAK